VVTEGGDIREFEGINDLRVGIDNDGGLCIRLIIVEDDGELDFDSSASCSIASIADELIK
jgi:hypothetical protein